MSETGAEPTVHRMLPLYEAKMIHHYDHRFTTYEPDGESRYFAAQEKAEPTRDPLARYWVPDIKVAEALSGKDWNNPWMIGWRDICRSTDERTVIASIWPRFAAGDTYLQMFPSAGHPLLSLAVLNSFVADFVARQKVGGTHLKYHVFEQLAILSPTQLSDHELGETFCLPRAEELSFTSFSLGTDDIYRWDPARRELLRTELDAAMFHLYGLDRDEVDYIMDTFPIVKRKDEAEHGEYRTKRLILEIYDDLARCLGTGEDYQTRLDPPPADPSLRIPRPERTP